MRSEFCSGARVGNPRNGSRIGKTISTATRPPHIDFEGLDFEGLREAQTSREEKAKVSDHQ